VALLYNFAVPQDFLAIYSFEKIVMTSEENPMGYSCSILDLIYQEKKAEKKH
jgi:hypothetical protein